MLPLKRQPPKPTWQGNPPNLVNQFVAFVRQSAPELLRRRLASVLEEVYTLEGKLQHATRENDYYRGRISYARTDIARLKGSIQDLSGLSSYEDGLAEFLYHPMLLGLRHDERGRLVAHLRIYKDASYIGDFEIGLYCQGGCEVAVCQTDVNDPTNLAQAYPPIGSSLFEFHGVIPIYAASPRTLLREGNFTRFANCAIDRIINSGYTKVALGLPERPTEPAWHGYNLDLELALRRTLEWSINAPTLRELEKREKELKADAAQARKYADLIRRETLALEQQRAEHARLEATDPETLFDPEDARRQLRRITALPGVMGVRFIDYYGQQVPVFHVRTTIVHDGRRYDMGDHEVRFINHTGYAAVVNVHQTRPPLRQLYYHNDSVYDGEYADWFCFGSRATQLRTWFETGRYDEFMNVAVNCMNLVNPSSTYSIPEHFREIDMDATWKPIGGAKGRRRQRRKTSSSE